MKLVPLDEDLLGFCDVCIRMRWLRLVAGDEAEFELLGRGKGATVPHGVCRSCARDDAETAATLARLLDDAA